MATSISCILELWRSLLNSSWRHLLHVMSHLVYFLSKNIRGPVSSLKAAENRPTWRQFFVNGPCCSHLLSSPARRGSVHLQRAVYSLMHEGPSSSVIRHCRCDVQNKGWTHHHHNKYACNYFLHPLLLTDSCCVTFEQLTTTKIN